MTNLSFQSLLQDKITPLEAFVCGILLSYGVNFICEDTFTHNLLGVNNGELSFDFAVFKKGDVAFYVEVDGRQHYDEGHKNYSADIVEHDKRKNHYCDNACIPLMRLRADQSVLEIHNTLKSAIKFLT